jgi:hypothetical protein
MNTATNVAGLYCMPWLNDMIRKFELLAKEIKCFASPSQYFRKLFAKYRFERQKSNYAQGFLDTAECRVINTVYHNICEHWVHKGALMPATPLDSIDEAQEGDVISIRCPTIFTGYHFIFAVVGKKTVDIYQSYGYTRPLYKIGGLSTMEFKRLINNMRDMTGPLDENLKKMKEIEEKIYGTKYEEQMHKELREINRSSDSDGIKVEREELETELFQKNVVQTSEDFGMAVYKFVRSVCVTEQPAEKKSRKRTYEQIRDKSSSSSQQRKTKRRRTDMQK